MPGGQTATRKWKPTAQDGGFGFGGPGMKKGLVKAMFSVVSRHLEELRREAARRMVERGAGCGARGHVRGRPRGRRGLAQEAREAGGMTDKELQALHAELKELKPLTPTRR